MKELENDMIEFFQKMGVAHGIDNVMSSIMGICYISPDEIAMEDIAEKTGYSLASISMKVKVLEQIGFIEKRNQPGTKKVYLYMG